MIDFYRNFLRPVSRWNSFAVSVLERESLHSILLPLKMARTRAETSGLLQ